MIINLTPHVIDIYPVDAPATVTEADVPILRIAPESAPARIAEAVVDGKRFAPRTGAEAVPVTFVEYGHAEGLPFVRPKIWLVVNLVVALALPRRPDLLVPYRQVRNAEGAIVGCRGLARPVPAN